MYLSKNAPKSPLRYPGGKSKARSQILKYIPDDTKTLYSPFMGGGWVELACAYNNVNVKGFDLYLPLVEFWQCILEDPIKLNEYVKKYHPLSRNDFYEYKTTHYDLKDIYDRAAVFFAVNKSSFSGMTFSAGMSKNHPLFNESTMDYVRRFKIKNLQVSQADFKTSIEAAGDNLLYLDPPYDVDGCFYGDEGSMHRDFDHEELCEILKTKNNWILSYNDNVHVRSMYKNYTIHVPNWTYYMTSDFKSKEVLIMTDNIAEYKIKSSLDYYC